MPHGLVIRPRCCERHGFVGVGQTSGDNEEGAPDGRYLSVAEEESRESS